MRHAFFRVLVGATIFAGTFAMPAAAAVYSPQQALPPQTVQQFLSDPGALLTQFPNGGAAMINAVRDLAASDPQTLNGLIGLLSKATPDQASAIGTALGQVAQMAVNSDPPYANNIQTAVVESANNSAEVAFSAVVGGNIKLTATAPGGGAGGGGEEPTGQSNFNGGTIGTPFSLHTFATNTPDSFSNTPFTPATPVSQSTP
jgi:hypothetical protein